MKVVLTSTCLAKKIVYFLFNINQEWCKLLLSSHGSSHQLEPWLESGNLHNSQWILDKKYTIFFAKQALVNTTFIDIHYLHWYFHIFSIFIDSTMINLKKHQLEAVATLAILFYLLWPF